MRRSRPRQIGAQRYLDLVRHHGLDTVNGASEDLMDYSERLMRQAIRECRTASIRPRPSSTAISTIRIRRGAICKIVVTIRVSGDELTVDLTGTSPQVPDGRSTCRSKARSIAPIWLTLRSILLDSVVYGNIPQNSGLTRPITIVAPKGTLANPDLSGAGDRPLLPGQCARRHRHEGAWRRRCPTK